MGNSLVFELVMKKGAIINSDDSECCQTDLMIIYFKIFSIYFLFRGSRREGERERGRNINVREKHCSGASCAPPPGDQAHNPGMCPHRELIWHPFALQPNAQQTEPCRPGQLYDYESWHQKITLRTWAHMVVDICELWFPTDVPTAKPADESMVCSKTHKRLS